MKVIVIGCTHAGTAAILNIRKDYPEAEIVVYERNDTVSFLSCGIALYVGGVIEDPQELFYCSPEKFMENRVVTKMRHDVTDVDLKSKIIRGMNMETGEEFDDSYDKLVVTTGSWPIIPDIPGIDLENILLSKTYDHSKEIVEKTKSAKKVVVIGGGYIGVELVEAFRNHGKSVTLINGASRILNKYLDKEFTDIAEESFRKNGIELALGETVTGFEGVDGKVSAVVTCDRRYECDMVIMCIGFRPNTDLFKEKLDMLPNGAIIVDEYMRTSDESVFAAGDSCAVTYNPTGTVEYIPLATNAVRMGTLVAKNISGPKLKYLGTQGTSGIKIYDYNIAATGLTEDGAASRGIKAESEMLVDSYRPEFMPEHESAQIKIVYESGSRRLLGAQILSKADLTQSINTLSVCIQNKMTVEELAFVDFFFQPHYNKPWNYLNSVALKALK
jgi:NADPH-dependent 2,4-dienoyl-CoA reductase/sulfur reductase-like enzyme